MTLLIQIASHEVLDAASEWLCKRRRDYPADADVCAFRFAWSQDKVRLRDELLTGRYLFAPLSRVTKATAR